MTEAATRHSYDGHALGMPCWASLRVHRLAPAQDFYHRLFGWEFSGGPQQLGPYVRGTVDGHAVAGLGQMPPDTPLHVAWLPYMASPDADITAARIRACGGTVAVGPLAAEEAGRMAIASDPAGAPFGVWQAGTHPGMAHQERGAPGTPVWFELIVRESAQATAFYPMAFGYETARDGGQDMVTLRVEGEPVADIRGMGREMPPEGPHWKTYFAVEDTDAVVRHAVELGGRKLVEPHEGPFGRRAELADPEGAEFSVVEWSPASR